VIRRQDYTAERAARRIRRILGHPRFAARAAEIGAQLQKENGLARACDALEAMGRHAEPREQRSITQKRNRSGPQAVQ
jgi:UDP:flavonoid glycosyltransferase YjiC (YdhE family)